MRKEVSGWIDKAKPGENVEHYKQVLEYLNNAEKKSDFTRKESQGRLYHVELAPKEDEYLLWDKPLSEQSEKVKAALNGDGIETDQKPASREEIDAAKTKFNNNKTRDNLKEFNRLSGLGREILGRQFYRDLQTQKESNQAASEYLHSLGIRGIKYLDGTSRGKGEGNYNYVVFNDALS